MLVISRGGGGTSRNCNYQTVPYTVIVLHVTAAELNLYVLLTVSKGRSTVILFYFLCSSLPPIQRIIVIKSRERKFVSFDDGSRKIFGLWTFFFRRVPSFHDKSLERGYKDSNSLVFGKHGFVFQQQTYRFVLFPCCCCCCFLWLDFFTRGRWRWSKEIREGICNAVRKF